VLNSNFEQTAGDYTSGRVMFAIPQLPEGKHELMLRAWDVMNNSTTVYLGFKVVNDLKPKFSIDVTDSPARESTSFVITHDRPGQNASVTIQVSGTDGMLQWTQTCRDESGQGVTVVDWNLHGNSGHRMQPGLYIVRATVGTDGGGSSSATCKLVIVGR
jgi:flagellar hook assembly protein FlgD